MFFRLEQSASSVKFSPFAQDRIAVGTAQNYGIVGNGALVLLQSTAGSLRPVSHFLTADATLDVAWSEEHDRIVASSSGDSTIRLWDIGAPAEGNPVAQLVGHAKEVPCLDWNAERTQLLLSGSWDDTARLWDVHAKVVLRSFERHQYCVYTVKWYAAVYRASCGQRNPQHGDVFMTTSGDCTAMLWDQRQIAPSLVLHCHANEVLSADWCKYNDCILATAATDKSIKVWDVRHPNVPLRVLLGHQYPVRKVAFSPHEETLLLSCSYDMSVRLWDTKAPEDALRSVWSHHTEFAVAIDWSVLTPGIVASGGWDSSVCVWNFLEKP